MFKRIAGIILCLLHFSLPAQAALLRYDVSFDDGTSNPSNGLLGFMIFETIDGTGGNLFPNIVDWRFEYGSFVFNPSNTRPMAVAEFIVDSSGAFVSDGNNLPRATYTNPCFSIDGCQDVRSFPLGEPFIYFAQGVLGFPSLGGLGVAYPGQEWEIMFGTLTYSDPISVPLPGVIGLFALGLLALRSSRRLA